MKPIKAVLFILVSLSCVAYGQFEPFKADITYHYAGNGLRKDVRSVKIEEVSLDGGVTTYTPYRMTYYDASSYCRHPYAQHWCGDQIHHNPTEKSHIFDDGLGNSIVIYYDRPIEEEWVAAQIGDREIRGRITSYDMESFLGIQDSVMTISFNAYRPNGAVDTYSKWGRACLALSKNHGYIELVTFGRIFSTYSNDPHRLSFRSIEIAGMSDIADSHQNLVWSDVIDIGVGDEIHTVEHKFHRYPNYSREIYRQSIFEYLNKWFDDERVYYQRKMTYRNIRRTNGITDEDEVVSRIDTMSFSFTFPNFNLLVDELYDDRPDLGHLTHNQAFTYEFGSGKYVDVDPSIRPYGSDSSCWDSYDYLDDSYYYVSHHGGPYFEVYYPDDEFSIRSLLYSNIGGVETGEPVNDYVYSSTRPAPISASWKILPNPFSDRLELDFGADTDQKEIRIYSLDGRLQHTEKTNSTFVSTASWSSGLYIVKIISPEGECFHKVVKE